MPLGGAAGVELNRRMMRAWGIDGRAFTGYTFLTNLWDVASKLLLPVIAVVALARAGEDVSTPGADRSRSWPAPGSSVLVAAAATVLVSPRGAGCRRPWSSSPRRGAPCGSWAGTGSSAGDALLDVRGLCAGLVAQGWLRMSAGIAGLRRAPGPAARHVPPPHRWRQHLAGGARRLRGRACPHHRARSRPGGVGVADLGLVGVLLALGGDPVSVTGGAVLYRAFIFAVEIPVGSGALGVWLLGQRRSRAPPGDGDGRACRPRRIAHVTDVFLPRLGGIETHVDDLVRHQRAAGSRRRRADPVTVATAPAPRGCRRLAGQAGPARGDSVRRRARPRLDVLALRASAWPGRP